MRANILSPRIFDQYPATQEQRMCQSVVQRTIELLFSVQQVLKEKVSLEHDATQGIPMVPEEL
jgi:hypothetical protein